MGGTALSMVSIYCMQSLNILNCFNLGFCSVYVFFEYQSIFIASNKDI